MQLKVLIAESDPTIVSTLSGLVVKANAIPLTRSSTVQGSRDLAGSERPHVAICAAELAGRASGVALIQFLRQLDEGVEAVLLSDDTSLRVVENAIDEGVADFLPKPLVLEDVQVCLTRLLKRSAKRVRFTDDSSPRAVLLVADDHLAVVRIQKLLIQISMDTRTAPNLESARPILSQPGLDILLLVDHPLESDEDVETLAEAPSPRRTGRSGSSR